MKKTLALILAMLLLISLVACGSNQNSNDDDDDRDDKPSQQNPSQSEEIQPTPEEMFEWEYTDEGVKITRYKGSDIHVVIPDVIDNKKVVSVGNTFAGNVTMETLVLPKYITDLDVGNVNLEGCDALKRLEGPGIEAYGAYLQSNSLEELVLPSIGFLDFQYFLECKALRYIEIPNVSYINICYYSGGVYFYQLDALEELVLPEKMYIGKYYDDWSGDLRSVFLCDAEYVNRASGFDNADQLKFEEITESNAVNIYSEIVSGDKITVNGKVYTLTLN